MFQPFSIEGSGLHSGRRCRATLAPAAAGTGLVFVVGGEQVAPGPQTIDPGSTRGTTLHGQEGARVQTVEHLLAALAAYGATDLTIGVDGGEVPILDGSAQPWARALIRAGFSGRPRFVDLGEAVTVEADGSSAALIPLAAGEHPEFSATIEYVDPVIGLQSHAFSPEEDNFVNELAGARTFALAREVDELKRSGLALGGSLDNALVFGPDGPLNPGGLRFANEPVRHKLLDALGDLYLLGALPWARLNLVRPGHALLHELVRRAAPLLGQGRAS
jgi:UDP-3-O-[3-hydroxymyristoyl] N-acetylglucosamine deacetylase